MPDFIILEPLGNHYPEHYPDSDYLILERLTTFTEKIADYENYRKWKVGGYDFDNNLSKISSLSEITSTSGPRTYT